MDFGINEMIQLIVSMQEEDGSRPFDKGYKFYFDETNNIREFSLKPSNISKVNAEEGLYADFILGGICFKNNPNYDRLFSRLGLQSNIKELKSKHIFRYNNYQNDFCGDRITELLKWFDSNQDVYLHYAIENNLYFALVDIVDSLWEQYPQMMSFHFQLKDALYRVCKRYQDDVLELLCQYGFPNVSKTCLQEFARKISKIIDNADIRDDFYAESLRQMLKSATEMTFIVDNEPFVLQKDYFDIYLQRMATFRDSTLIFDEEPKIIEALDRVTIPSNTSNYSFVDSTTERFIQISDCIIACLSKTFKFLDSIDSSMIIHLDISEKLRDNLRRLRSLIDRSDRKNELLILNLNAQSLTQDRYEKLAILCN